VFRTVAAAAAVTFVAGMGLGLATDAGADQPRPAATVTTKTSSAPAPARAVYELHSKSAVESQVTPRTQRSRRRRRVSRRLPAARGDPTDAYQSMRHRERCPCGCVQISRVTVSSGELLGSTIPREARLPRPARSEVGGRDRDEDLVEDRCHGGAG
jgi:hypothetical protein